MCCIPYNFSWSIIYYVFFPCWTHVLPFYLTVTRTSLLLSCHSVSDRLEITPHMAHACCYDTQASNLDILDFLLSQKRSAWCSNFFFRRIRKFANTDYEPRHICQSVCPHGIDQLHFGRIFFKNFIFECCSKICIGNPSFTKNWQEYRILYMKNSINFFLLWINSSQNEKWPWRNL